MSSNGGNIVNLSKIRKKRRDEEKSKRRRQKQNQAAANRVAHGRPGAEQKSAKIAAKRAKKSLEGKKREADKPGPDEPPPTG